jgi:tRNA(Phe) wybutosine-synthesizing methylase Tyw3
VAGLIVLTHWTKIGGYIIMFWLLGIAVNLLTTEIFLGHVMRDVEIAIRAFVLSQLTAVVEQQAMENQRSMSRLSSELAGTRRDGKTNLNWRDL